MKENARLRTLTTLIATSLLLAACGLAGGVDKQRGKAQEALQRGDYPEAVIVLRNLLDEHPQDAEGRMLLVRALVLQGEPEAATQALDAAAQQGVPPATVLRERLLLQLERGGSEEVLAAVSADDSPLDAPTRDYLRARALQAQLRMAEALALYSQLAQQQPDSAELQLRIGQCHAFHGRNELAAEAADKAIAASGRDSGTPFAAEAWLLKSTLAQRAGDEQQALEAIERALESAAGELPLPTHAGLLSRSIESALNRGEEDQARARYAQLQKLLPQAPLTQAMGAQLQLAGDQPAEAVAALQQLRQQSPEFAAVRPMLVAALLRNGAMEQALKEASELAAQAPGPQQAQAVQRIPTLVRAAVEQPEGSTARARAIASALLELQQPVAAHAVLSAALVASPDDQNLALSLAQLELRSGRGADALARAQALAEDHPDDPAVQALLAEAQQATGDAAGAAQTYARLWEGHPSAVVATALSSARRQAGLPGAREPLEQWLARHPGETGVRMALALDLQTDGQHAAAAREYERALAQMGTSNAGLQAVALNNLAWVYHVTGDPRALDTARRAHEIAPRAMTIADTYGWLLLQRGRAADALPLLRDAAQDAPESPQIRYHFAAALAQTGDRDAARALLQDVLLDPAAFEGRQDAEKLLAGL